MEQIFTLLGVASVCLSATLFASTPLPCPTREASFSLPLASEYSDTSRETALGYEFLLYGDETKAQQHLSVAHSIDPSSPLPLLGLSLLSHDPARRTAHLDLLRKEMAQTQATPVEAFYCSAFLELLDGKTTKAAQEFAKRSTQYARDHFSAAWAILLLHYCNCDTDAEGNFLSEHQEALKRAEQFYDSVGKEVPPACYLRAIVEESQAEVSKTALDAACRFAEQMPNSPIAQNLYAHLLFKSGHFSDAARYFHKAYTMASHGENELLALRARLYESVALWCSKNDKEALRIRRELNALNYSAETLDEKNIFFAWESHTLPLRLLVLRETLPTLSELRAALNAATPANNKHIVIEEAARCIADTLEARIAFHSGKRSQAISILSKAEKKFQQWEHHEAKLDSLLLLTPFKRLHSACVIAINKAKAELYASSSDTWNDNVNSSIRQSYSNSHLAPVIPQR